MFSRTDSSGGILASLAVLLILTACGKDPRLERGEQVFTANCKVCHAQGINGAPIIGNKKMWASRIAQGHATLLDHALSGYGLMPARGGKPELGDDDISAAIFYMISTIEP